jgi:hypothetical protein
MNLLSDSQPRLSERAIVSRAFAARWHIQLKASERDVAKAENVGAPDSFGTARPSK